MRNSTHSFYRVSCTHASGINGRVIRLARLGSAGSLSERIGEIDHGVRSVQVVVDRVQLKEFKS